MCAFQNGLHVLKHLGNSPVSRQRPTRYIFRTGGAIARESPDSLQQLPPPLFGERRSPGVSDMRSDGTTGWRGGEKISDNRIERGGQGDHIEELRNNLARVRVIRRLRFLDGNNQSSLAVLQRARRLFHERGTLSKPLVYYPLYGKRDLQSLVAFGCEQYPMPTERSPSAFITRTYLQP